MSTQVAPRVGYIGAGWTDRVQIPAFRLGGLTAQAIASARPESARRVAEKYQIPEVYSTWQELLASPTVDLVSITPPPHLHKEIALAALQAGKHVLCEKPMALDVAEAEAMFAAAQAAPDQLALIDHELRFHPMRVQLRQMLREGAIGTLFRIEITRLGPDALDAARPYSWLYDAARGGGMLNATGSHLLDQARWLVGRIEAVAGQLQTGHYHRTDPAAGRMQEVTADDHADILLRFGNGMQGRLCTSALAPGGYGIDTLVVGSEGALRLDNRDRLWILHGEHYPQGEWEEVLPAQPLVDLTGLPPGNTFAVGSVYLAQALAAALPQGETTLTDAASFYDGLVVQRQLDAVRRSHHERTWIDV